MQYLYFSPDAVFPLIIMLGSPQKQLAEQTRILQKHELFQFLTFAECLKSFQIVTVHVVKSIRSNSALQIGNGRLSGLHKFYILRVN